MSASGLRISESCFSRTTSQCFEESPDADRVYGGATSFRNGTGQYCGDRDHDGGTRSDILANPAPEVERELSQEALVIRARKSASYNGAGTLFSLNGLLRVTT
jgi:hypothetical protein